jgi:hypothetical protein
MRLYARSDVMAVAIPADGGGCGLTHSRPVLEGAPAKLWPLDCPACSAALKGDPLWAADRLKIPLTPDEESIAEDMEKKGDQVMHQVSAALAQNSIQGLRDMQQDDLRRSQEKQERAAMEARYESLTAELSRLRKMVTAGSEDVIMPAEPAALAASAEAAAGSAQAAPQAPLATAVAEHAKTAAAAVTGKPGACTSCGGSLRAKGQRGPTPKGTCMACRRARAA